MIIPPFGRAHLHVEYLFPPIMAGLGAYRVFFGTGQSL